MISRLLAGAVLVLALGACGGDDDESAASTPTLSPAAETAEATSTAVETTAGPSTSASTPTTERHTGEADSCAGDRELFDRDGDGWGACLLVTTTTEAATTTTESHTGRRQACDSDMVLYDDDGDGWGLCTTPTTTAAPTTTVDPAITADVQVFAQGATILAERDTVADAVGKVLYVKSVDVVKWDVNPDPPPTAALVIAVTTGFNGVEYRDETAWSIYRSFASFWDLDGHFRNELGEYRPGFILTVDTTTYIAPMELMMRVADLDITSTEFLNAARQ